MTWTRIETLGESPDGLFEEALRGLAFDAADRLLAVGDTELLVLETSAGSRSRHPLEVLPTAVTTHGDSIWIAHPSGVVVLGLDGGPQDAWDDPVRLGRVTDLAVGDSGIYLADAASRRVQRYSLAGEFLNEIGDHHRKGGFHIPNGAIDLAMDGDGRIVVANPGMHRIERYRPDGEMVDRFGHFDGVDPAGFGGCCNPTNLAVMPGGTIVVTEKAGPRVKVYASDGTFQEIVAQAADFAPTAANMVVAVDSAGRIAVADPSRRTISLYRETKGTAP